jgi:flagellar motility protein MotE (MotC chaperone)
MKSIAVISTVTFVLIFGAVILVGVRGPGGQEVPVAASGMGAGGEVGVLFADLAAERDRIQREKEDLLRREQALVVEEEVLAASRRRLEGVITELESRQQVYVEERERSATRLARMYEAMKPEQAAPIVAALDTAVILDIMTRMKERPAAKILGRMDPTLAAIISTRLSTRGGVAAGG